MKFWWADSIRKGLLALLCVFAPHILPCLPELLTLHFDEVEVDFAEYCVNNDIWALLK